MKEYLRAVCLCAAIVVVVLFATGMVWYGYLVTAALFGLTRGETATAALGDRAGGRGRQGIPGAEAPGREERGHRKGDPTVGGPYGKTAV